MVDGWMMARKPTRRKAGRQAGSARVPRATYFVRKECSREQQADGEATT